MRSDIVFISQNIIADAHERLLDVVMQISYKSVTDTISVIKISAVTTFVTECSHDNVCNWKCKTSTINVRTLVYYVRI